MAWRDGHGRTSISGGRWTVDPTGITQPCDLWWGGKDTMATIEYADWFQRKVPHARLHVDPDAGHAVWVKNWSAIVERITAPLR